MYPMYIPCQCVFHIFHIFHRFSHDIPTMVTSTLVHPTSVGSDLDATAPGVAAPCVPGPRSGGPSRSISGPSFYGKTIGKP